MTPEMLATLEKAISKALDKYAETPPWSGYVHPVLTVQMARAAELVFDASMDAQEYAEREMK